MLDDCTTPPFPPASVQCDVAISLHRPSCRRVSCSTKKDDPPAAGAIAQAEHSARPGPGRTNSVGAGPTLPKPSHCHAKLPPVTVQYDVAVLLHRLPCRRTSRSTKKDDPPAAGAVAQAERSARPGPGRTNSVGAGPTLPKPSHCHAKLPPVTVQCDVAVLLHRPPCRRTSRSTKKDDPPAAGAIAQAEHSARSGLGHTNSPRPSLIPPKPSHCHAKLPPVTVQCDVAVLLHRLSSPQI